MATIDQSGEQTRGACFLLGFRRKLGRVVLNRSSLEKNKSLRFWWLLTGCKQ